MALAGGINVMTKLTTSKFPFDLRKVRTVTFHRSEKPSAFYASENFQSSKFTEDYDQVFHNAGSWYIVR